MDGGRALNREDQLRQQRTQGIGREPGDPDPGQGLLLAGGRRDLERPDEDDGQAQPHGDPLEGPRQEIPVQRRIHGEDRHRIPGQSQQKIKDDRGFAAPAVGLMAPQHDAEKIDDAQGARHRAVLALARPPQFQVMGQQVEHAHAQHEKMEGREQLDEFRVEDAFRWGGCGTHFKRGGGHDRLNFRVGSFARRHPLRAANRRTGRPGGPCPISQDGERTGKRGNRLNGR